MASLNTTHVCPILNRYETHSINRNHTHTHSTKPFDYDKHSTKPSKHHKHSIRRRRSILCSQHKTVIPPYTQHKASSLDTTHTAQNRSTTRHATQILSPRYTIYVVNRFLFFSFFGVLCMTVGNGFLCFLCFLFLYEFSLPGMTAGNGLLCFLFFLFLYEFSLPCMTVGNGFLFFLFWHSLSWPNMTQIAD